MDGPNAFKQWVLLRVAYVKHHKVYAYLEKSTKSCSFFVKHRARSIHKNELPVGTNFSQPLALTESHPPAEHKERLRLLLSGLPKINTAMAACQMNTFTLFPKPPPEYVVLPFFLFSNQNYCLTCFMSNSFESVLKAINNIFMLQC